MSEGGRVRVCRRRRGMLAVTVVLAMLAPVVLAAPAAALHQYLWWNEDGATFRKFGANASITIYQGALERECDFFSTAADVYIVPSGQASGSLTDVGGAPNTIISGASGGLFIDETIGYTGPAGTIGPGRYAVVYDECQDGKVDPIDFVLDPAFEVEITGNPPDINPRISQLKADAGLQAGSWGRLLKIWAAYDRLEKIKSTIECLASGLAACALSQLTDYLKEQATEAARAALGLTDPKEGARKEIENLVKHYAGIHADPPDPDFRQPSPMTAVDTLRPQGHGPVAAAQLALGNAVANEARITEALLRSIERYQGADAAGDVTWALVHAQEARGHVRALGDQLALTDAEVDAVALAVLGDATDYDGARAFAEPNRARFAVGDFSAEERRLLDSLGLDAAGVQALQDHAAGLAYDDYTTQGFLDELGAMRDLYDFVRPHLAQLDSDLADMITFMRTDPGLLRQAPVADAGGPYTLPEGGALPLDASASVDHDSAIAAYRWDLDRDGAFDDATGATPTFAPTADFNGLVGVEVTDDTGLSSVAYARVDVGNVNDPPTLTLAPSDPVHDAAVGIAHDVTASATDPDGDAVTIRWLLDGAAVGTGPAWTFTATAGDLGMRALRVEATDGRADGGTAVAEAGIRVRYPDADGDGWPADVDCDDADPEVRPGRNEVIGNGVDDDCDPATLDEGNPPTAGFTHSPAVGLAGDPVQFTDTSTDPDDDLATWAWDFGDGQTSSERHPSHRYAAGGTYTVSLQVTDAQGTSATATAPVRVSDAPAADFTVAPSEPLVGETVTFTDASSDPDGPIAAWRWEFGDGAEATGPSAVHAYAAPGDYGVRLTVTDEDGHSATTTRQLRVRAPPAASFGVGAGMNVAAAANGALIDDASGYAGGAVPGRAIDGNTGSAWQSAWGQTTDQWVRVALASRQVVDRVILTVPNATTAVRDFELRVSTSGTDPADFSTVLTGTLAQQAAAQEFTFAPAAARYVEFVARNNHGATNGVSLSELELWTRARQGGVVSLLEGERANAVDASSFQTGYEPAKLIDDSSSTFWRSASGQRTDQWVTVELGGGHTYTVDRVRLQPRAGAESVRDFAVRVSTTTADDAAFTTVLSATAASDGSAQTFSFPATQARFVQLRVASNHGSTCCVGAAGLEVLTTDGRNAARGAGVGAVATATSAAQPAGNAIDASDGTYWQTASGQTADQALTVLLKEGGPHVVDRLRLRSENSTSSVRDFALQVSTTTAEPSAFTTVLGGTLPRDGRPHEYTFAPTEATWARLVVHDNHGGTVIRLHNLTLSSPSLGGPTVAFDDRSADADGRLVAWRWEFGDGTTSAEQHPVHTYAGPGSYPVSLTVTDDDGLTASTTATYTVLAGPTAAFSWTPEVQEEGRLVRFSDDTATSGTVVSRSWFFEGANARRTEANPGISFPDDGEYAVTLTATDHTLLSDTVTRSVTIINAPPTASAGPNATLVAGQAWTPSASWHDPGPVDRASLQCRWDFGDGSAPLERTCNLGRPTHTYEVAGVYTLTLAVSDKDGASATSSATATVHPRPTFVSVHAVPGSAAGGGIDVVARLWVRVGGLDARLTHWEPLSGQPVTLTLGEETRQVETGDDGSVRVRLALPRGGGTLTGSFAATAVHAAAADDDAVPPAGLPPGDVVFVIDESGSMGSLQAKVRENVTTIAEQLGASVDFQLGLVGFGDGWLHGMPHTQRPLTDNLDEFTAALGELSLSGGFEPGYDAVAHAVDGAMGYRPNAGSCVVLVADEPPQRRSVTKEQAIAAAQARNAVVLSVVTTTYTDQGYIELAEQTGGQAFDLRAFASDPEPVMRAIIDRCVAAIQARPDLSVTVDDGADRVHAGQESTYTVTVANDGASDVTGVIAEVRLPAELTIVAVGDGGTATADGVITWPAVDLLAGETATRTFTTRAAAPMPAGVETVEVLAAVADDGAHGPDLTPANNSASDVNTVVANGPPVAADSAVVTDEDEPVAVTLAASDPDGDALTFTILDGPANGSLGALDGDQVTYTPAPDFHGTDTFTFTASDGRLESGVATVTVTVNPVNDPPVLQLSAAQVAAQYSDPIEAVTVTATDVDSDPADLVFGAVGLPGGLTVVADPEVPGRATVSGRLNAAAGSYAARIEVSDGHDSASQPLTVEVAHEDAEVVEFSPEVVQVDGADGDADTVTVAFRVVEVDDGHPSSTLGSGDGLANARPVVVELTPVGTGSGYGCTATNAAYLAAPPEDTAAASCDLADVAVNVYEIGAVIGGDFFTGAGAGVVTIYDPSLGHITGGGSYLAADGTRTNFGFNVKYLPSGKIQGSLLAIHHRADGRHVIKSNALRSMAISEDADGNPTATFNGKATYGAPFVLGCGEHKCGDYGFTVYVEDRAEPGAGADRFWMEVTDPAGEVVEAVSQPRPAATSAATLRGGNIQVPHRRK